MSLNIKNDEAHAIARELARVTGETMTEAITIALRERLARVRGSDEQVRTRSDAIMALGRAIALRMSPDGLAVDHGELLYDELGLPR
jgi:antitoxin VapB